MELTDSVPRVAVVVPAFNRAHVIGATLDSVTAQTLKSWKLVVFDDGSTDDTAQVAARHAERDGRISVVSGPNGGVASARNRGLAATDPRVEFVVFLDSDDVWEPDALETLVAVLDERPDLTSVHSLAHSIDIDGQPYPDDDLAELSRKRRGMRGGRVTWIAPEEPTTFAEMVVHNWILTPGTQLIRRSVLDAVGVFDPITDPADDWDLAIRISRVGDIGFVDRSLLGWRRHDDTLTQTSPRWRQAYFITRDKALGDPTNTPTQRRAARRSYLLCGHGELSGAGHMIRDRRPALAGRQLAKAVYAYLRYWRAEVRAQARRYRSTRPSQP